MMKESTWNGLQLRRSGISIENTEERNISNSVGAAQFHTFTILITPFHGRWYGNLLEVENYRKFFCFSFVLLS